MTKLEVLKDARKLLARRGKWIKGDIELDGSFCAIGAINFVSTGDARTPDPTCAARILGEALGSEYRIATYNDAKSTRKKGILALFDKAIRLARKETK